MKDHGCDPESFVEDAEGFLHPRCVCGWVGNPVPDLDLVGDELMYHAWTTAESASQTREMTPDAT